MFNGGLVLEVLFVRTSDKKITDVSVCLDLCVCVQVHVGECSTLFFGRGDLVRFPD